MPKIPFKYLLVLFINILVFFSCNKDSNKIDDNTLVVSPNFLMNIAGKNWEDVEPNLKNKKGYWYTEFSQDQSGLFKAAISLPAYDTSNAITTNCSLLLNTDRISNKVSSVSMSSSDSLSPLNKDRAYALMLYYYNNSLKKITDTTTTKGVYSNADGTQVTTNSAVVLDRLKSGIQSNVLNISYNTTKGNFSIALFKNDDNDNYLFNYNSVTP